MSFNNNFFNAFMSNFINKKVHGITL